MQISSHSLSVSVRNYEFLPESSCRIFNSDSYSGNSIRLRRKNEITAEHKSWLLVNMRQRGSSRESHSTPEKNGSREEAKKVKKSVFQLGAKMNKSRRKLKCHASGEKCWKHMFLIDIPREFMRTKWKLLNFSFRRLSFPFFRAESWELGEFSKKNKRRMKQKERGRLPV